MATYIPSITDYIPQVQPFSPDYNFLGNVLQTKQSQYDKGYHETNQTYTTLLHSPMLRDSNIKRREEFFKVIDSDIKRISGLDLSKQENVDSANKVFKGFYDDKVMVNDMVKTKKAYAELQKAESFKNCLDPDKCGGQYWEEGVKALNYKMQEFKNVSDAESMNYQIGDFTPYYNWQKDAMKTAKEAGLDVKRDHITGQWIVTQRNGELVQGGLYGLFKSIHGDDPRVNANYKTKAYVQRKDFVAGSIGEYGDEQTAEKAYIDKNLQASVEVAHRQLDTETKAFDQINSRVAQLERKKATKGLTNQEKQAYDQAVAQKDLLAKSKSSIQSTIDNMVTNVNNADIESLRHRVDTGVANSLEERDMVGLAQVISHKDDELTYKANPYGEIWARAAVEKQMKTLDHYFDLDKLEKEYGLKMKLEDYKHGLKSGQIPFSTAETLEAVPGSDVKLNTEDNPDAVYERNRIGALNDLTQANEASSGMIFNLFSAAKTAALKDRSAGATQWLKENFGEDWNKISDRDGFQAALKSRKLSPMGVFNSAVQRFDDTKNPTGDYNWAQPILNKHSRTRQAIEDFNEATVAKIGFNISNNKKVANNMISKGVGENAFMKDADLILTPGGFVRTDLDASPEFVHAYQQRHHGASEGDAEDAYSALKKNFFYEYNKTKGISLDQGVGLSGGGMISSNGKLYRALDPANADANHSGVEAGILSDLSKILSTQGSHVATLGGIDSDTYKKGSMPGLDGILDTFLRDAVSANSKTHDRPIFDAEIYPVAANKENVSAMKLRFDPDYLKKFVGTKENPGPLYKRAGELADGITLFYDNSMVNANTTRGTHASSTETILKTKGNYTINAYDGTSGKVDFHYDNLSGQVHIIPHYKGYRKESDGVVRYGDINVAGFDVPISQLDIAKDYQLEMLELASQDVLRKRDIEAANNKNKQ